jgi:hypothetical protein
MPFPEGLQSELREGSFHKVHIYLEYHSICHLVRIGTPPASSPARECVPPGTKGGGDTRMRVRGWVEVPQFRRLEKKPRTLST